MKITDEQIEQYRITLRKLSNSAQYAKAYNLAKSLKKKYPQVLLFAYYEAVMTAEDDFNYTEKQVEARYQLAAKKLKPLLSRIRGASPALRKSLRNEYYWFSKQPYKQYLLGVEEEKQGSNKRGGFYSQGVGAAQLAKQYALAGKKTLALRWAKKSELAWLNMFKLDPNWFNSYFFYAMALGFQDRMKDCDKALAKAARIAKKPKNWKASRKVKKEIMDVHQMMYP